MKAPGFWQHDGLVAHLLSPLGAAYTGLGRLRRWRSRPAPAPVPVLCVGNATVGGTGKTPIVLDLLTRLRARGVDAHGLCRGHGGRLHGPVRVDPDRHGSDAVGDEALLLAARAPTWAARDRLAGATAAAVAGARVVVLDDGLQEPRLMKQRALLVVDATTGIGNGRVVPAGPLREPFAAATARADVIVLVGDGDGGPGLDRGAARSLPRWRCHLAPSPDAGRLAGRRMVAFAGIGRPDKLFETARAVGVDLAETVAFADHHAYRPTELEALRARASALGAGLLTTSKDRVRLPPAFAREVDVLRVEIDWEDTEAVDRLLARLVDDG